jgi:uncharacterized membrane protein YphA (DoxX/SURF4 family)
MSLVRLVARPLLATSFVASGIQRLRHADTTAAQLRPTLQRVGTMVPSAGPVTGNEKLVARVMGATQLGAGLLLACGKFSRLAAFLLVGTSALNALIEYQEADTATPEGRNHRRSRLLKNLSLIGGVLLAVVDTEGRPGLAWRAEQLAASTRKNAKSLSKDARKQLQKADQAVRSAASDVTGR